jgi:hypothetical protein
MQSTNDTGYDFPVHAEASSLTKGPFTYVAALTTENYDGHPWDAIDAGCQQ